MDSFELNKIIGAILGTLLFVMGAGFLAEAIYAPRATGPGYELPEPEGTEAPAGGEEAAAPVDIGTLLVSANAEQGAAAVGRCKGCHNFEEGAGNKQGPELYGVAGRPIASHEGFTYSDGMKEHAAGGKTWTYEELNGFLHAPKDWVPGTKMNFPGLKDDKDRANVIAYLASISPGAPAFPAPAAAPAEATDEAAAPAEATAPSGTEATPTDADAVETPTQTQSETPVQGTPTQETGTGNAAAPADGTAAPAADSAAAPADGTAAPAADSAAAPAADGTAAPAAGEPVPEVSAQ
jgi:cytochrome c